MESNLRPLSLGEILDRTAQLYRSNFLLFAGIYAVYGGVILVLGLLQIGAEEILRARHVSQYELWVTGGSIIVFLPLSFIFAGAALAANNKAVSWVHLGEPATIRGAYSSILPRLGRYLWLMIIVTFILWTPFLLICGGYAGVLFSVVPMGGKGGSDSPQTFLLLGLLTLVFVLLGIAWFVYAILMGLRYSLAVPASVVENLPARKALRRSIELSKGSRGRIFLLGLLIVVIQIGLVFLAEVFFVVAAVKSHGQLPVWVRVLQQFVGFLTNSFIGPMYATGLTLFYYDQRIRKEGFDIEWMMRAAGLTPPEPAPPAEPAAPQAAAEPWLALDAHFEPPPAAPTRSAVEPDTTAPPDSGSAHE
ncbi:MAG: hypothetical protein ABSC48_18195 [Terracidiphilus sp.]|jgi:hypothetical protein